MSIRSITLSLFLGFAIMVGLHNFLIKNHWEKTEVAIEQSFSGAKAYEGLAHEIRLAQSDLDRQTNEWKNILIRGSEPEAYRKHLELFNKYGSDFRDRLSSLSELSASLNVHNLGDDIESLQSQHIFLSNRYREILSSFDPEKEGSSKATDLLSRGIESSMLEAMSRFANKIDSMVEAQFETYSKSSQEKKSVVLRNIEITSAILVVSVGLILGFFDYVMNAIWGKNPKELNAYLRALSGGNFKQSISLGKKDKSSIAYNAKAAHHKMVGVLKFLQGMCNKLETSISGARFEDSPEKVLEVLKKTKRDVHEMSEALNRIES